jgi:hypothetical protein
LLAGLVEEIHIVTKDVVSVESYHRIDVTFESGIALESGEY